MFIKKGKGFILSIIALSSVWSPSFAKEEDVINKNKKNSVDPVIGIDLGTSYSSVGVFNNGKVQIIANDQGSKKTASYLAFSAEGQRLIGDDAKNQLTTNPENTIFDFKRLIGRQWNDSSVLSDLKFLPFQVIVEKEVSYINVKTVNGHRTFALEEVSAMMISKMKKMAENYLGESVSKAVITVPAYFNYNQRQATLDAGTIAGFDQIQLINEPSAAAIAYGFDKNIVGQNILVFKLGAGSLDISVFTIDDGVFEVMATNGDTHLGGNDFDQNVVDYFVEYFIEMTGKDIRSDKKAFQRLVEEVERAKQILSDANETLIEIVSLFEDQDFIEVFTRDEFEELNEDLFRKMIKLVDKVLKDANFSKTDIDDIVLVGGSTRIPKIRQLLKDYFKGKELHIGAGNSTVVGATIQSGILSGQIEQDRCLLMEVNPYSISFGLKSDGMTVVPKNTKLPVDKSSILTTTYDNQTTFSIGVHEGDRLLRDDNPMIGILVRTGIPPLPKGKVDIEVKMRIDGHGVIDENKMISGTGTNEPNTAFVRLVGLTAHELERLAEKQEKLTDEDIKFEKKTKARNEFKSYVLSLKKKISDLISCSGRLRGKDLHLDTFQSNINEMIQWLQSNPVVSTRLVNAKMKSIENKLGPIIARLEESCARIKAQNDEL